MVAQVYNIKDFLYREQQKGKSMERKQFLNSKEVANLLSVSVRTVCAWAERYEDTGGKEGLPSYRLGLRALSFKREEIEQWIQTRRVRSA